MDERHDSHEREGAGFDLWDAAGSDEPRSTRSRRVRFVVAMLVLLAVAALVVGWALIRMDATGPSLSGYLPGA